MVYEVKANQKLSQTSVETLTQKCINLVTRAACLENIKKDYIEVVLEYYNGLSTPVTIGKDPVTIAWNLLRQGGVLCQLLNFFRANTIEGINPLETPIGQDTFRSKKSHDNIHKFLSACRDDLYMTDDQLFSASELYTDDTNTLVKAISITDKFFERIQKTQGINFKAKAEELRKRDSLLSNLSSQSEEGTAGSSNHGASELDKRLKVLLEMVDTERKYVGDLESLQNYAEELRMDHIIATDSHVAIFANLDKLVDFQRRFLLAMERHLGGNALSDVQASYNAHIGNLFVEHEAGFSVYDSFCPNHKAASEMVQAELANLRKKQNIMDPQTILPSYLIKPTQRICKYPLLIREIIKFSEENCPDMKELQEGLAVMKRVGDRVNEKQRREENLIVATELRSLINNWEGVDRDSLGDLQLYDKLMAIQGNTEKEVLVYLFDQILILCREGKTMVSMTFFTRKLARTSLSIKGSILMSRIMSVVNVSRPKENFHAIKILYQQADVENFTLRFRNDELRQLWMSTLNRLKERAKAAEMVAQSSARRRSIRSLIRPVAVPGLETAQAPALVEAADDALAEAIRVKIFYCDDVYVTVVEDVQSVEDLKQNIIAKIKSDYDRLGHSLDLPPSDMRLKYVDEFKDLITIIDDNDIAVALGFSPNYLPVHVFRFSDIAKSSTGSGQSSPKR